MLFSLMSFFCTAMAVMSSEGSVISADVLQPLVNAITSQLTPSSIVSIIALVIGAGIGFVFLWWGIRKVANVVITAFQRGKLKL